VGVLLLKHSVKMTNLMCCKQKLQGHGKVQIHLSLNSVITKM